MNGPSIPPFSSLSQCNERTVHPQITEGTSFCSLGLVEAGLSCGRLQELGGLADWDPEHGAVSDIAQYASVAALRGHLWRRGGCQGADFVNQPAGRL